MNKLRILVLCVLWSFGISCARTAIPVRTWEEAGYQTLTDSRQGIPAYDAVDIDYKQAGRSVLAVRLEEPVVIAVASKPEKWGFFQFPNLHRTDDDLLVATWNMAADAVTSYGSGETGAAVSEDNGRTWQPASREFAAGGGLELPNGDRIKVHTPKAIKVEELELPDPVGSSQENYGRTFVYYRMAGLPQQLQGAYIARRAGGRGSWTREQAAINDPRAVRYADSGFFPVVWWGDLRLAPDHSILAGIYPGFSLNQNDQVDPSGILFYRSTDNGHSWDLRGRIPYQPDLAMDPRGDQRLALGFTEPASIILDQGAYLCVMRTTDGLGNSPMYLSHSDDLGVTWARPSPLTRAGVLPRLLQLDNGVIVLSAGRPGVQLRFAIDGQGERWTDPLEMLPFENENDEVSCGYTEIIPSGADRFLLIYSDFKYRAETGEIRKAIKVRQVSVKPRAASR